MVLDEIKIFKEHIVSMLHGRIQYKESIRLLLNFLHSRHFDNRKHLDNKF